MITGDKTDLPFCACYVCHVTLGHAHQTHCLLEALLCPSSEHHWGSPCWSLTVVQIYVLGQ